MYWKHQKYTNKLLNGTNSNNSEIFLNLIWFLLLKDSTMTVLYLPWHQHQSRKHVIKKLCLFTNILDVKKKTATRWFRDDKSKRKEIKYGNTPWALKQKQKGHSKISEEIKKYLYNWVIHHPQVVQSPIANDFLKVKIYGYTEPQIVPKLLLQVSVRELHNNLVSDTKDGGLKEARYEDDNIIISDSTLRSLLPPQL